MLRSFSEIYGEVYNVARVRRPPSLVAVSLFQKMGLVTNASHGTAQRVATVPLYVLINSTLLND